MRRPALPLLGAFLVLTVAGTAPRAAQPMDTEIAADEALLRAGQVAVDGPGLVEFFRKQVAANDAEENQLEALVRQLADKSFRVRDRAAAELIEKGTKALPALRKAVQTGDLEMRRRAERCIEVITRRRSPELIAAAARLLRARRPEGACAALLAYLPGAAEGTTEEEVRASLAALAVREGRPDPSLTPALQDRFPARRAVAALVLGQFGTDEQRQAVRKLAESDSVPVVRFRAAQGLLAAGDRGGVTGLLSVLREGPLPLAEEAEDLLCTLAGKQPPTAPLAEKTRADLHRQWQAWWQANRDTLPLARLGAELAQSTPTGRAGEMVRRFLTAYFSGDENTFVKVSALPFLILDGTTCKTKKEFDNLLLNLVKARAAAKKTGTVEIRKVMRLDEYAKGADDRARKELEPLRSSGVRVVLIQGREESHTFHRAFLVRLSGAQAWVIGVGPSPEAQRVRP